MQEFTSVATSTIPSISQYRHLKLKIDKKHIYKSEAWRKVAQKGMENVLIYQMIHLH